MLQNVALTAQNAEEAGLWTTLQLVKVKAHAAVCNKRKSSTTNGKDKLTKITGASAMTVQHARSASQMVRITVQTMLTTGVLQLDRALI